MFRGIGHREYAMTAPLGPLAHALVGGASRRLVRGGASVVMASRIGTRGDEVRFRQTELAHVALSPTGVTVTFESVVDTDE